LCAGFPSPPSLPVSWARPVANPSRHSVCHIQDYHLP
jgi:hypothetical protein